MPKSKGKRVEHRKVTRSERGGPHVAAPAKIGQMIIPPHIAALAADLKRDGAAASRSTS